jgi:hypothetical protein
LVSLAQQGELFGEVVLEEEPLFVDQGFESNKCSIMRIQNELTQGAEDAGSVGA